jgi:hypothetical protein
MTQKSKASFDSMQKLLEGRNLKMLEKTQRASFVENSLPTVKKSYKDFDYQRFHESAHSKKNTYFPKAFLKKAPPPPKTADPGPLKTFTDPHLENLFVKGRPKALEFALFNLQDFGSLEQKAIKYFFGKYTKLFKELFKSYSGMLKQKAWQFGDRNYTSDNLLHHSEFWTLLSDLGYISSEIKPSKVAYLIREVKLENCSDVIRGELFVTFEEFKKCVVSFLIFWNLEKLKQDLPVKCLLDKFVDNIRFSAKAGKKFHSYLFDNPGM